jgi:hypothetical protein
MSSTEQNNQIVREVLESLIRGDIAPLEPHSGLEETRSFIPRLMSAFPDLTGTVLDHAVHGRDAPRNAGTTTFHLPTHEPEVAPCAAPITAAIRAFP